MTESCQQRDLIRSGWFIAMWGWTAAAIAGQIVWPAANVWFSVALLLAWAAFCGFNARRCGRLHCYFTPPVLLLGALAILLLHFHLADFSGHWINLFLLTGVAFSCLAEIVFGRYFPRGQRPPEESTRDLRRHP